MKDQQRTKISVFLFIFFRILSAQRNETVLVRSEKRKITLHTHTGFWWMQWSRFVFLWSAQPQFFTKPLQASSWADTHQDLSSYDEKACAATHSSTVFYFPVPGPIWKDHIGTWKHSFFCFFSFFLEFNPTHVRLKRRSSDGGKWVRDNPSLG